MEYLPIGEIIGGTLRNRDRIPALIDTLATVDSKRARRYSRALPLGDEGWDSEEADEIYAELLDYLNDHAAPFCHVGEHADDSASLGVWLVDGAIERAEADGELIKVAAGEPRPYPEDTDCDYCAVVSDHGNLVLYEKENLPERPGYWRWSEIYRLV
jgi:hypothetical protein